MFLVSSVIFVTPVGLYFAFFWFTSTDVTFVLVYCQLIAAQMLLVEIILDYSFTGSARGIVKLVYYLT